MVIPTHEITSGWNPDNAHAQKCTRFNHFPDAGILILVHVLVSFCHGSCKSVIGFFEH